MMPLGATWTGAGTTFAVWSGVAEAIDVCLFDVDGAETRVPLGRAPDGTWRGDVAGVGPGQRYGFRVTGPWDPHGTGTLCDPQHLLLDPYARAIAGEPTWDDALFPLATATPQGRRTKGSRSAASGRRPSPGGGPGRSGPDTAPYMPRSVVVDPRFDWGDDRPPGRPLSETVIYEAHVKGQTMRHPGVPHELRGTYAGLAHPAAIDHLLDLGITAVELLPVHHFIHDRRLVQLGLRNYWGYNSIGFLAPHAGYAAAGDQGGQVAEFKSMVRALHAAGLEVILDVVFNHTAESDESGPILAFKGLDNAAYYRLQPGAPDRYLDVTATGNTLDTSSAIVGRLIVDSLRYWVEAMHVDGFRFDLAAALARDGGDFNPRHPLLQAIRSGPQLGGVKLIAEPWDAGEGGYRAGQFPPPWSEWNDGFRDAVRDAWRGGLPNAAPLGYRLTGSRDRFGANGRLPTASVNYVTAHDGFTLADVVTYETKRNLANGEENRDGESRNHAWNHGVEGPTDDPAVLAGRARTRRNLLATLLLSQGVPMLLAGDELGRSQGGNNNAYCQDNEVSWLDWSAADRELMDFTRRLIALRAGEPAFRRPTWIGDESIEPADWFTLDGEPMTVGDWEAEPLVGLQLRLGVTAERSSPPGLPRPLASTSGGPAAVPDAWCLVLHVGTETGPVRLAPAPPGAGWRVVLDTAAEQPFQNSGLSVAGGAVLDVVGRSIVLLQAVASIPGSGTARV